MHYLALINSSTSLHVLFPSFKYWMMVSYPPVDVRSTFCSEESRIGCSGVVPAAVVKPAFCVYICWFWVERNTHSRCPNSPYFQFTQEVPETAQQRRKQSSCELIVSAPLLCNWGELTGKPIINVSHWLYSTEKVMQSLHGGVKRCVSEASFPSLPSRQLCFTHQLVWRESKLMWIRKKIKCVWRLQRSSCMLNNRTVLLHEFTIINYPPIFFCYSPVSPEINKGILFIRFVFIK